MSHVAAIIICFHPDREKLARLIGSIAEAVDEIILFNNGGLDEEYLPAVTTKISIETRGGQNLGIATALNIASEAARRSGCRYAVTFDQDSHPEKSMIPVLLAELQGWQARGHLVAAIGPQLVDVRAGGAKTSPFVQTSKLDSKNLAGEGTQPVSLLITSGCLFDLEVWRTAARFDDRLFIDYVDFNWCWRLAMHGYQLLGTTKARMRHELSGGLKPLGRLILTKYGPVRRYFQCRNAVYHLLHEPIPLGAKRFVMRNIATTMIAAAYADDAVAKSLWQCLRGCVHGVFKKLGPFRP